MKMLKFLLRNKLVIQTIIVMDLLDSLSYYFFHIVI